MVGEGRGDDGAGPRRWTSYGLGFVVSLACAMPATVLAAPPVEAGDVQFRGDVQIAVDRRPLAGAVVLVFRASPDAKSGRVRKLDLERLAGETPVVSVETDAEGHFELEGIPPGRYEVVVTVDGFQPMAYVEEIGHGDSGQRRYMVAVDRRAPYRTVVADEAGKRRIELGRRGIERSSFDLIPGSQGDPLKGLQALPGVGRPPLGLGLFVLRGADPFDTGVYFAQHPIPVLFHFAAVTTFVNPDLLASVEVVPSNYDARWGNAIGGTVYVEPRAGRTDGVHGYAKLDLFDVGTLVEGPLFSKSGRGLKGGSFIATVRRSWIDVLVAGALPEGTATTQTPRYWDYGAFFDVPVGGGSLSLRAFGGDDQLGVTTAEPNDTVVDSRNLTAAEVYVHRVDLAYAKETGPWRFEVSPAYRGDFFGSASGTTSTSDVKRDSFLGRAQIDHRWQRGARLSLGTEVLLMAWEVEGITQGSGGRAVPVFGALLGSSNANTGTRVGREVGFTPTLALYLTGDLPIGRRVHVLPGVRLNQWGTPLSTARVDPRLRTSIDVADHTTLRLGTGLFSQTPQFQDLTSLFGNPQLRPLWAWHNSIELEHRFERGYSLLGSIYYNAMYDLVAASDEVVGEGADARAEALANTGQGRAMGFEVMAKKKLNDRWTGWVSYTLAWSQRKDTPSGNWYGFDFDQRHAVNVVAAVRLPRQFTLSGRFRLTTGNPYTPVERGIYDASSGDYMPVFGPKNSARFSAYHQLDIRLEKRWSWRFVALRAYLDLLNTYNRRNVEALAYSYDFGKKSEIHGLPILPSIGLKLEF